jgi:hypothetical protein
MAGSIQPEGRPADNDSILDFGFWILDWIQFTDPARIGGQRRLAGVQLMLSGVNQKGMEEELKFDWTLTLNAQRPTFNECAVER